MREPVLRCAGLEKWFAGVRALKGVSLEVAAGEMVCLVGENGAGKSTLINAIGGALRPDAGRMELGGAPYQPASPLDAERAGVAVVHQELNLFANLSTAENIFLTEFPTRTALGMRFTDRKAAERGARALLEQVGLEREPGTPVEELPQGDRQLVEIAKALRSDARAILFDEPTTSLTARETERLFGIIEGLRRRGIGILYVSHALEHVLALADRIVVLRDGAAVASGERREFSSESLIRAMVGRDIDRLYPTRGARRHGDVALAAEGVSEPGVVENISFELRAGEILGLAGLMGSGRSELARILFGLERHRAGSVRLFGEALDGLPPGERIRRGLALVTESRRDDGLFMDAPIDDNVRIVHPDADAGRLLRELRVSYADASRQPVSQLSGGNQQKVALAKWLAKTPRALILDEPTRGIDVGAKQEIYRLIAELADKGLALLVISSEVEELVGLCDRVLVMAKGELRGEFPAGCTREQIMAAAV